MNKVKKDKPVPYNLRLPKKLKTELERQAREQKRSLNQHIVFALERFGNENPVTA